MAEEYRNDAVEKQRVKELTDRLEKGLDELFESVEYVEPLCRYAKKDLLTFINRKKVNTKKQLLLLKLRFRARNIWQKCVAVTQRRGYIFLIMILPERFGQMRMTVQYRCG